MAKRAAPPPGNGDDAPWDADAPATGTDLDIFGQTQVAMPVDVNDLVAGLGNLASAITQAGGVGGGLQFLTLQKAGFWTFGQERNRIEDKSEWAIDIRTLRHGHTAWKDGRVLNEVMVPANQPVPAVTSLPQVGADYTASFSVELRCLTGEDKGVKTLYKSNSWGGRGAFAKLTEGLYGQVRKGTVEKPYPFIFPIVQLRSSSWTSREFGIIATPILHVLRWVDAGGRPEGGTPTPVAASKPTPGAGPGADTDVPSSGVRRRRVA